MLQRREAAHHFCLLRMAPLQFILIIVLQFEGVSGGTSVYRRPGDEAVLLCGRAASSGPTCSNTEWLLDRENSAHVVIDGRRGDVRRRLGADCSLLIENITAEDAGRYTCRLKERPDVDSLIYLNVLTISASPADADPKTDGELTLNCSLLRFFYPCPVNSIRWVHQTGALLLGKGVGFEFLGQNNCVSALKVKRQDDNSRNYTCQFVDEGRVEIEADYTPVFSTGAGRTDPTGPSPPSYVTLTLRISGVLVMMVLTVTVVAAVIRRRGGAKALAEDAAGNNDVYVTYENVEAGAATVRLHPSAASTPTAAQHSAD